MINFEDINEIRKLDPQKVYESTGMLPAQCEQIWKDAYNIKIPKRDIDKLVIAGMGGSSYGGHVLESLFADRLKIPLVIINDYHLPKFADSKTLVVLTSYSGTTEETLSCATEALRLGCQTLILTSGGELGNMVNTKQSPGLVFDPKHNPCGQPRLGTGYIIVGTIALIKQTGLIDMTDDEFERAVYLLRSEQERIIKTAKELSLKFDNKIPLIIAADFLKGNAHILRNQMNETAKSFANFSRLPELNHHLMEGLKYPKDNKLEALFLKSDLYETKIKQRLRLTEEVIAKNNVGITEYDAQGNTKLDQVLNVLSFGGYLSLFLALIYDENPSLIPWVDYFKQELKK